MCPDPMKEGLHAVPISARVPSQGVGSVGGGEVGGFGFLGSGVSGQTIYNWRRQEWIDSGQAPGLTSTEQAELMAARRRITELE
ncbi:MAG: hypothetical protein ACR2NT_04665, partial [Acidimicrobiia bacterium]